MVHEFYLPLPEAQVLQTFRTFDGYNRVKAPLESVTSIIVTGPDTIIHYDHWEDGYEADINNPTQPTTQIWGDGNDANGIPPGYAFDPLGLPMGSVISLRNDVPLPRNPTVTLYDARDRVTASKALVISRALWSVSTGPTLAEAVEVTATIDHGTHYVAPIGEDISINGMFDFVGLAVMADMDNTVVSIDKDGPGGAGPITVTLNRGESYYVNGGVMTGAEVISTKPVQAHLLTGDIGATYETRWYTLIPVEDWFNRYMSPVGTSPNGQPCYIFLYNHNSAPITINATSRIGSESLTVEPGETLRWQMPQNSGAMFASAGGEPFFAVATAGANRSANDAYDWGFTLIPQDALSSTAVVGWGPGSSDMTRNGSPVFVSPSTATRIYVDYNGDGQGTETDPNGGKYDVHYDLAALQSQTIFDPDGDQTAMRIYTTDGALFTAAWGQDPATALPWNPFLDMGTTVLPLPEPKLVKTARIVDDVDPAGPSLGDTIEYRIVIDNKGLLPLGNTLVLDTLPTQLDYVANSTTLDGETLPDNTAPGTTPFPLDESGYTIPIILRAGTSVFTYRTTIVGTGSIVNRGAVPQYEIYDETEAEVLPPTGSHLSEVRFVDADGNDVNVYPEGDDIYLWFKDLDANRNTNAVETITLIIHNETTGDYEAITLTETGEDTGIFVTTDPIPSSPSSGLGVEDGTLHARAGDNLTVYYVDPLYGDSCSDTATLSVISKQKKLYLSDPDASILPHPDDPQEPEPEPEAVQYKRQIFFDNSTRNEDLKDFPVLVHLTSTNFNFAKAQSDGHDIRFYDADDTTPLSYEIESWNPVAQEAYVWVKVPQIDKLSNTDSIWMHYGNPLRADAQAPAAVWSSDFEAVWHMDEVVGTTVSDSTGNGWDGTANANVVLNAAGQINGADAYPDGVQGYTKLDKTGAIVPVRNSPFTFESWLHVEPNSNYDRVFAQAVTDRHLQVIRHGDIVQVGRSDGSSIDCPLKGAATVPANRSWFHFVWVFNGSSDALYINGERSSTSTTPHQGAQVSSLGQNYIGARDSSNFPFGGKLDEMRISSTARSAEWVDAQYASMTDTFATFGEEVSYPLDAAGPDTDAWQYKRLLTFDNSTRNEALKDFPVLVTLTAPDFDFSKAQSAGQDIRFLDSDGITSLSYEIESWDATAGKAYIWVKVPQVDASSSTDGIYMYYGNPDATDAQSATNVWGADFRAVWHMDETSGTVNDSTGNNWTGTPIGVTLDTAGKINGADEYPDGTSCTRLPSGTIVPVAGDFTFESWVNVGPSENYDRIFSQNAQNNQFVVVWVGGKLEVARYDGSAYPTVKKAASVTAGTWVHFAWVKNGSTDTLYVNGRSASAPTVEPNYAVGSDGYNYIAARDGSNNQFDGKLDEMRISGVARSAAWISAQYDSMNGAFVTMGEEQENAPPVIVNALDRIDPAAAGDTTTARSGIIADTSAGEWLYKKQLTFLNGTRAEDLKDFPVLVHLTSSNFDFTKAKNDGSDIRFYDADGTTPLSYEIESWNASTKQAYIWVKVPQIDQSSSSDSIWMEYGNPAAADAQSPSAVWNSGFQAVWHMDETSGTAVGDSTGNGWNGTATSGVLRNSVTKINGADRYPDSANNYTKVKTGNIIGTGTDVTFESWVYVSASADYDRVFTHGASDRELQIVWTSGQLNVARFDGTATPVPQKAVSVSSGTWVHFAWVFDGTTESLYVNGVPGTSRTPAYFSAASSDGNYIASRNSSNSFFNGSLDEMRISSVVRSANWINAQYAAMTDTFINYGTEQSIPSMDAVPGITFTQLPNFSSDFVMPAGGTLSSRIYVAAVNGTMPVNPAISAKLKSGGMTFATLSAPTAKPVGPGTGSETIYDLEWSTILDNKVTIPAGQAVTLEIISADSAPIAILYDSVDYPSFVSLPADTVIEVDSLAIFDAPYPDGSPTDTIIAGSKAYVRATVSDPFGAYDITGLDLTIPEMGVDVNLDDTAVVASTQGTKTYEYVCFPPMDGSYSVTVTAHEGTEGITDVAATRLHVTSLDFGTPSTTEFTITNNGAVTNIYDPGQTVYIRVTDLDQNTNPDEAETITVTVTTSTGDTETITLTETGPNTGIFTAAVPAGANVGGESGDGTLNAPPGTVLDVVYVDPSDPTDTSSDTAIVTQPPETPGLAIQKQLADPSVTTVVIGGEVVYRVRVSNTGTTTLDPVALTDSYPAELRFVSAVPEPTSHDSTNRVVTWSNIGPLAVRDIREFELTFEALAANNSVINTATATYPGGSQSDNAFVAIVNAGHTVTKTLISSKNPASYGDIVEYRIVVANTGTTRITTLPLEDTFSAAYLSYVPESATIAPDGIGAGLLFWENIAAPGGLDVGGAITNDLNFRVVGAGNPIINTAAADYSVDEHGNPVPPARDDDDTLVTIAGLISGHVWNDLNKDGVGDVGEPRLEGVEIRLFDAASNLVATTTTVGTNGFYEFPNLPDGQYTIVETDPPGFTSSGGNQITVTVANSSVHTDQDFFDYRLPLNEQASISGTVWNDANRNGATDDGEKGIKGVTVTLYQDVNGDSELDAGDKALSQTYTDNTGGYAFSGLPAGDYIVVESDLPGYISTGDVVPPNDNQISVSVSAGGKVTGRDFFDARSGMIDGHVWQDLNGDGIFDEADMAAGLEGVTVTLKTTNGVVVAETTTAADGSYTFDNLPPGDYVVVQTDLPDWSSTMDADGTNDNSIVVSLPDGGRSANNNFLDTLPAVVRGHVFLDKNDDLMRNMGDAPVTNVLVRLVVNGETLASTNTDAFGYYEFSEVPPGVVSVLVSRVGATLIDVPAEGHAAYGDERRNRAVNYGDDEAVIVHTVFSGEGVLKERPAETLNFGFITHPMSTAIDILLHATPGGVTIQLWTVDEAGCGDIVIYAWIDNDWVEVGRVPAWLVVGEGANAYSVVANGLSAGGAYYLKVIDEVGNVHLSLTPVAVDSLKVDAVRLDLQHVMLRFNTEPGRRYQVEVSTDLVTWRTEIVSAPTAKGWTPFATVPFTAGSGTHTEVRVPRNGRARAFFRIKRVDD